MQHTAVFEEQVNLTPKDMKNVITSIDDLLLEKLKMKLEGKCSRHGFVIPDKLKILSRSMGYLEKGRFTGSILYHVQAEGDVINPPDGTVLTGKVIRKNKMGIYVSYEDAIRVIIPRDLHIGNKEFEDIQVDQEIRVEIKKSRFQVNDPFILSVGVYMETTKSKGNAQEEEVAATNTSGPTGIQQEETLDDIEEGVDDDMEDVFDEEAEETDDAAGIVFPMEEMEGVD